MGTDKTGLDVPLTPVRTLAIGPGDRLLEIGCGGGTATALVAQRLTTGRILAVDRAAGAVRLTRERNAAHIQAGTVEVRQLDITAADLPTGSFDTVFAVNVSLFWLGTPPGLLDRIARLLAPRGTLHVFARRPTRVAIEAIAAQTARTFREAGLSFVTTTMAGIRAAVAGRRAV